MTDIDEALAGTSPATETATSTATARRCKHPRGARYLHPDGGTICERCGQWVTIERSRRGKSAARFGKDQERRIERVYGPRKVGEYGDAIDLLGATFKWQSKATHAAPPVWLASVALPENHRPSATVLGASAAMLPLRPDLAPLVITSYVSPRGTRDWIWVRCHDWQAFHGIPHEPSACDVWYVMSGAAFLDWHGRDAETLP